MTTTGFPTARPKLAVLVLGLAAMATTASAQERSGLPSVPVERLNMPETMERPFRYSPVDPSAQSIQQFRAWSRRSNRPRILLFWNTAFSDETSTRSRLVAREGSVAAASPGVLVQSREATLESERLTGGRVRRLDTDEEDALEDAFISAFVQADANLVDRAAVMRKASVGRIKDDRADQQYMEAMALEQGIEYLIEVLPEYAASSESGLRFSVRVLHVPSSRVLARFRSDGRVAEGPERLVARAGGFRRERTQDLTPKAVGEALAAETMGAFR